MRLYANENFPLAVVRALRALGHDVVTVREAGNAGRALPDEDVLEHAVRDARVLVTLNRRDFIRLARTRSHAGIVVCTVDPDPDRQARRIDDALKPETDLRDRVLRVNLPNV